MKRNQVQIGGCYVAKVSGKLTTVRIVQANPLGGWDAINKETGRGVRVRSAARLRRPARQGGAVASPAGSNILPVGTRVAISIDQGLQKAEGVVREVETDDGGTTYRVDVTSGDQCNEHRTADGELWVCQFEVKPLPA